jgi:hypothetical protein
MRNDEEAQLDETEYLLRSKKNAERLFNAIQAAERGEGEVLTVEELRKSVGLDDKP